jgi:hypothetical protein
MDNLDSGGGLRLVRPVTADGAVRSPRRRPREFTRWLRLRDSTHSCAGKYPVVRHAVAASCDDSPGCRSREPKSDEP